MHALIALLMASVAGLIPSLVLAANVSTAPASQPTTLPTTLPTLGANASLNGRLPFPADNPWNTDISKEPVDPSSDRLIASIGAAKALHPDFGPQYGIPYVVISGTQAKVDVTFRNRGESDPGPYPIPPDAPVEGGPRARGDRHVLVIDRDHWLLYELYAAYPNAEGASWRADSGAIFKLNSNELRPAGWTSGDAAGLPIFPGLVRAEDVYELKELRHAVRFTVRRSRRAYVPPATHRASRRTDADLPPMGMRVRLKADYDLSGFSAPAQVILTGLKKYGMILADNGGDWYVSGAPDPRFTDELDKELKRLKGGDFQVVKMVGLVAD